MCKSLIAMMFDLYIFFCVLRLKREFQFPLLPQNVPENPVNNQGTNKPRRKTKYLGIIEDRSPQSTSANGIGMTGEEGTEDITPGNGVQCGCQCIIM